MKKYEVWMSYGSGRDCEVVWAADYNVNDAEKCYLFFDEEGNVVLTVSIYNLMYFKRVA